MKKYFFISLCMILCFSCFGKKEKIASSNKKDETSQIDKINKKWANVIFTEDNINSRSNLEFNNNKFVDKKIGYYLIIPDDVILEYNIHLDDQEKRRQYQTYFLTILEQNIDFNDEGFCYFIGSNSMEGFRKNIRGKKNREALIYKGKIIGSFEKYFKNNGSLNLKFSFIKKGKSITGYFNFMTDEVIDGWEALIHRKNTFPEWKNGGKALIERIKAGDPEIPEEIANTYKYFMQIVDSLEFFEPEPVNEDTKAQKNTAEEP